MGMIWVDQQHYDDLHAKLGDLHRVLVQSKTLEKIMTDYATLKAAQDRLTADVAKIVGVIPSVTAALAAQAATMRDMAAQIAALQVGDPGAQDTVASLAKQATDSAQALEDAIPALAAAVPAGGQTTGNPQTAADPTKPAA